MARFRLSRPAQTDLARILATSRERWGSAGQQRYATTFATALRALANEPQGLVTRDRTDLRLGLRSFHLRHARSNAPRAAVRRPVHVIYYREIESGLVEIVRILHERMEPARWLTASFDDEASADED
jgi:toxin ParE1/3/4